MAYSLPVKRMQNALVNTANALIGQAGSLVSYSFYDGTASVMIPIYRVKMKEDELIGDYRQGDCKFSIRFMDLPKPPAKYDSIKWIDGVEYKVVDYLAADKSLGEIQTHYVVVGRG